MKFTEELKKTIGEEAYKKLEDYGLIGNLETISLVGKDGSIDWACFPHIDSASVFAAILDHERGGHFSIKPQNDFVSEQNYQEKTNILVTTFRSPHGVVTITDFLPIISEVEKPHIILRKVTAIEGDFTMAITLMPRFDYARAVPSFVEDDNGITASWDNEELFLQGEASFNLDEEEASGTFEIKDGQTKWFTLSYNNKQALDSRQCEKLLKATSQFWINWIHRCGEQPCVFGGPWHNLVVRSALALKQIGRAHV